MPVYEYQCDECGGHHEHLQKISDNPIASCPACGSLAYRKLISAAGFQLKGSGWYATDFKGKPAPNQSGETSATPQVANDKTSSGHTCGGASCGSCS